jgi:membrane protein DedA with SNARE-associated domain
MNLSEWSAWALDIVRQHHAWGGPVCFVLAFGESLAFISLLVPATVMLIGIGGLVPLSDLSFVQIWLGAALGAAAGDWVSYWIGRHFKDGIGRLWPLSRYPDMLPRAHRFFERWGVLGVFGGRFLGPLRATIPLVAGISDMPQLLFQLANVTSAALWAFVLLAPGALGVEWLREVLG